MKKLFYLCLFLSLAFAGLFLWQVWKNNQAVPSPVPDDIRSHFDRSVQWLEKNYSKIEDTQNPILWWMIKQAANASNDDRLKAVYSRYKKDHIDPYPKNLWSPMFNNYYRPAVPDILFLQNLADYQVFFLYSLSCDADLEKETVIQKQLQPGFCSLHFLHPRCITHQLMGLRFMQRYKCGHDETVAATISELQKAVITELTWDFRVTDAYIQRVLMLVDTGAYKQVKPIWIKNILQAQNEDGGWDDLYPVFPVGGGRVFALSSMLPKIKKPHAEFHATAQGIMLLALLLEQK